MKKFFEYLFLFILISSCSSTSVSSTTGSGTGVGNGFAISGVIQTPEGTAASGATLELVPADFVAPFTEARQTAIHLANADSKGNFLLKDIIAAGSYRLWATDSLGKRVVEEILITTDKNEYHVDTLTTGATYPFTISISGDKVSESATIQLYGSRISHKSVPNSELTLNLPEGEHFVRISFPNTSIDVKDSVKLSESDTVYITIVDDKIKSSSYETDSIIVRSILDMNEQHTTSVTSISTAPNDDDDNGRRITELRMTGIDTLSPAIGGLSLLQELSIKTSNLTSIPSRIGELQELKTLDLSGNKINTLPEEIMELENVDSLNLKGNPLTDVPKEVQLWMNEFECDD